MKTIYKAFIATIFALAALETEAQDATFSQFDPNQIYYNPAYAGYKKEARFDITYRTLWPNVRGPFFPGPLATYSATGDAYFSLHDKFTGGVGAFVSQSEEGEGFLTTTSAGIVYSQHIQHLKGRRDKNDRFSLYLGFKAYYSHIHLNWSRLVFSDQLNPNYGISGPSSFDQTASSGRGYFDFDYGFILRNNYRARGRWYNEIGFAMSHVLAPTISITGSNADVDRLPRKYTVTYRSTIALPGDNFFIGPTVLFENQAKFYEVNAGFDMYVKFGHKVEVIPLSIGIYNRFSVQWRNAETGNVNVNTSAIILAITHHGNFRGPKSVLGYSIGFSVDLPYMGLGMQSAGAYELTLGLLIPYKKSSKMKCPFESF